MKLLVVRDSNLVTQADLENILALDAQIARAHAHRERIAAGVLARVAKGAEVEPGNRCFDIDEEFEGSTRRQTLIVR